MNFLKVGTYNLNFNVNKFGAGPTTKNQKSKKNKTK